MESELRVDRIEISREVSHLASFQKHHLVNNCILWWSEAKFYEQLISPFVKYNKKRFRFTKPK